MVSSPTNLSGVIMRGIDVERVGNVSRLVDDMREGKIAYLRDAAPLDAELEARRDREFDDLMERIKRERSEVDAERGEAPPKVPEHLEDVPDAPLESESTPTEPKKKLEGEFADLDKPSELLRPEDIERDADGEAPGGMPPLPHQKDDAAEGTMPPLPGQSGEPADNDDSGDGGAMPALPGQEDEAPASRVPGLIIGPELAKSLNVDLGDEVNVVTPNGEMGPMGPIPRSRPFKIVGIFYSGMYEFDANFAYTWLPDAKDFLAAEGAGGIEVKTTNVETSELVATALQKSLGPSFEVLDWKELNRSLFLALKLEKIAMFVVLTFIILVASFSIVAMLIMIVIEKGREIAVMKSMGATNGGIMRTFIFQGSVIGGIGSVLGLGFGLGICWFLAEIGFPLNSEVYYISTLPVEVDPIEVVSVVVCAVAISLLATVYPAIQAAKMNPVDGLRYD
jgi:lipoprotein-releasing system permease protein